MKYLVLNDRMTNRTEQINRYFKDLGAANLLSPDQENEVAVRSAAGDKEALNTLIQANLRFVISVAKQYSRGGAPLEELICQGNMGLIEAAQRYDPTVGVKFITFAVWYIRKEILAYLNYYTRSVRLPQNAILDITRVKKTIASLSGKLDRQPSSSEIIDEMEKEGWSITKERFETAYAYTVGSSIALESSDPDDDWSPIRWLESDENPISEILASDRKSTVTDMLNSLDQRERSIIELRLGLNTGEPSSFVDIGKKYGKSSEWARIYYDKGIRRLKKKSKLLV